MSNTDKVTEGNKLIAEFMGCNVYLHEPLMKVIANEEDHDGICYHCEWHPEYKKHSNIIAWVYEPNINWCQLMPVIEKIRDMKNESAEYMTENSKIAKALTTARIWIVYQAVTEFIKWYNQQPKP